MLGLGSLSGVTALAAVACTWWSADLLAQAYAFYTSQTDGNTISDDQYTYWSIVQTNSFTLQSLATPLLIGAIVALIALLAVLARRWDVAHRDGQDEATAAS
jgi:hypothetical protein